MGSAWGKIHPGRQTKRVLVVDDEPEVTYALQAFFLAKGYEMLTALDGIQAMRHLRSHPIDLVLLDMKMPGVNGVEVLKFLRAQSPLTKVIVVTGFDEQFRELVERLGVDGFMLKPFGIQALTGTIEEVLAGKAGLKAFVRQVGPPSGVGPVPKARLLLVEPSEYTFKLKEVFFTDPERSGGLYEVAGAYSTEEALEQLRTFRPDILLVDVALVGPSAELAVKAMASESRPQELILHGSGSVLIPSRRPQVENLKGHGVRVLYDESFTQAGLHRLGEVVRSTAMAHGLLEVVP